MTNRICMRSGFLNFRCLPFQLFVELCANTVHSLYSDEFFCIALHCGYCGITSKLCVNQSDNSVAIFQANLQPN